MAGTPERSTTLERTNNLGPVKTLSRQPNIIALKRTSLKNVSGNTATASTAAATTVGQSGTQFKRSRVLVLQDKHAPPQPQSLAQMASDAQHSGSALPQRGVGLTRNEAKNSQTTTHSHEPVSNRGNFVVQESQGTNTQLLLQDHNRRRLQAVVQTQQSEPQRGSAETRNASNSTSNHTSSNPAQRLKIINKKLITFSNNKTDRFNSTQLTAGSAASNAAPSQLPPSQILLSQAPPHAEQSAPLSARQKPHDLAFSCGGSSQPQQPQTQVRKAKLNSNQLGYRRQ